MELVSEQIGSEGTVKVEVKAGNIVMTGGYGGAGGSASVMLSVSADYFLDQLAAKIPGTLDDAVIGIFKSALNAL